MNRKKIFVVAALIATINIPQVSAENVEVFGGEFEETAEISQPEEIPSAEVPPKVETQPTEVQPTETPQQTESENLQSENADDLNSENSKQSEQPAQPVVDEIPQLTVIEQPQEPNTGLDITYPQETTVAPITSQTTSPSKTQQKKQKKLKVQKSRFARLTMDENYIYFLDKESVTWRRIPYLTEEYMADVWIRMIERDDEDLEYPHELVMMAEEEGKQISESDIEVLQHRRYYLEHYYLRPQTEQIQFLSELEIVDRPQNTATERRYDYQNWEYLIPGSTESIIYRKVIEVIGKSKAYESGHMTFADMVEEYGRISIR